MKISLIAAAALTVVAACAPQPVPQETETEVTKKLGLSGGACLDCAQDALAGACQDALDACAADLDACLNGGTAIEDLALCIVAECGDTCLDDGGPTTDPIDDSSGAGASGSGGSGDPGDIPGGLGGDGGNGGNGGGGGGGDTCLPDDGGCGGIDAVCDDLLACAEDCWFDSDDFVDCLLDDCGATEDLADECDL